MYDVRSKNNDKMTYICSMKNYNIDIIKNELKQYSRIFGIHIRYENDVFDINNKLIIIGKYSFDTSKMILRKYNNIIRLNDLDLFRVSGFIKTLI